MSTLHHVGTLYKMDVSYFSGKLEAYLRYKNLGYRSVTADARMLNHVYRRTGVKKVPALELPDGRWLFDTTPTMDWLEQHYPQRPATPQDPLLAFIATLIEDYADEWLWRPAMWWRWEPVASRKALGWRIAHEVRPPGIPKPFMAWFFAQRQRHTWLWGDGMNKQNQIQVRDLYLQELQQLEAVLQLSPYLLGDQPSVADFGYFASMFRHFGNDPDPAEVMRREAPHVYSWTARLWQGAPDATIASRWPAFDAGLWAPLLQRISGDYLPYLAQNAQAWTTRQSRFDFQGASLSFQGTVTHRYRVWCLAQLQQRYAALPADAKATLNTLLETASKILDCSQPVDSGLDSLYQLPHPSGDYCASWKLALLGQPRN